jgi:hypothetical protein
VSSLTAIGTKKKSNEQKGPDIVVPVGSVMTTAPSATSRSSAV